MRNDNFMHYLGSHRCITQCCIPIIFNLDKEDFPLPAICPPCLLLLSQTQQRCGVYVYRIHKAFLKMTWGMLLNALQKEQ